MGVLWCSGEGHRHPCRRLSWRKYAEAARVLGLFVWGDEAAGVLDRGGRVVLCTYIVSGQVDPGRWMRRDEGPGSFG